MSSVERRNSREFCVLFRNLLFCVHKSFLWQKAEISSKLVWLYWRKLICKSVFVTVMRIFSCGEWMSSVLCPFKQKKKKKRVGSTVVFVWIHSSALKCFFLPSPSKRQAFFLPYFQTTEKLIDVRWKQLHLSRQCSLKLNTSIFGRVGAAKFCRASAPKTSFFVWKKIPPMFLWTHPSVRWVTWLNQLQKACSRQPHHLQKVYTLFFGHLLVRKSSCFFIHFP